MLNQNSFALAGSPTALMSIVGVLDSADDGHLPLFAATLGMRYEEFYATLSGDQVDPAFQPSIHSDLLAKWVPELFPQLVQMLMDNRSCDDPNNRCVAHAIACACFGHRRLWQDIGLQSRNDVSCLLAKHFYWFYIRNTGNMRWKRFIFHELGLRLGVPELLPPGCNGKGMGDLLPASHLVE